MPDLETSPGIDECIVCYGEMRPATRLEVATHLRATGPEYRQAVVHQEGTWYACHRCGYAAKWWSTELD